MILAILAFFTGWRVQVYAPDPVGHHSHRIGNHRAATYAHALAFAACYGPDYAVTIHQWDRLHSKRRPSSHYKSRPYCA